MRRLQGTEVAIGASRHRKHYGTARTGILSTILPLSTSQPGHPHQDTQSTPAPLRLSPSHHHQQLQGANLRED